MQATDVTRYELPPAGISLLGYIVRRMHKTQWLIPVPVLIAAGDTATALAQIAVYTILASTSYGKAYYQPRFDIAGEQVTEPDPETGILVCAKLDASSPTYKISYSVQMPHGSLFSGSEEIAGTTIGLRGLGMPAPSTFKFQTGNYFAELIGTITSELAFALMRPTRIRAYGFLKFHDSAGNTGTLNIDRSQNIALTINQEAWNVTAPFLLEKLPA
jgi:hypothetical protein